MLAKYKMRRRLFESNRSVRERCMCSAHEHEQLGQKKRDRKKRRETEEWDRNG